MKAVNKGLQKKSEELQKEKKQNQELKKANEDLWRKNEVLQVMNQELQRKIDQSLPLPGNEFIVFCLSLRIIIIFARSANEDRDQSSL